MTVTLNCINYIVLTPRDKIRQIQPFRFRSSQRRISFLSNSIILKSYLALRCLRFKSSFVGLSPCCFIASLNSSTVILPLLSVSITRVILSITSHKIFTFININSLTQTQPYSLRVTTVAVESKLEGSKLNNSFKKLENCFHFFVAFNQPISLRTRFRHS